MSASSAGSADLVSDLQPSSAVSFLAVLIVIVALIAALPGALLGGLGDASGPVVRSVRGDAVLLYGRGVYEFDSRFVGASNRATDAVVLLAGIPLLLLSLILYRRSSRPGSLLLSGTLAFFVYVYGTYSVGVAYNRLFLLYIVLFAASLFALVMLSASLLRLASEVGLGSAHHRALGWFMLASGAVLIVVWAVPLLIAMSDGSTPARLDAYTTFVTYAIDLGAILPSAVLAGVWLLRADARGYVVAAALLVIEVLLAPLIALQTFSQVRAGETFTAPEVIGPVGGFVVFSVLALFALRSVLDAGRSAAGSLMRLSSDHAGG